MTTPPPIADLGRVRLDETWRAANVREARAREGAGYLDIDLFPLVGTCELMSRVVDAGEVCFCRQAAMHTDRDSAPRYALSVTLEGGHYVSATEAGIVYDVEATPGVAFLLDLHAPHCAVRARARAPLLVLAQWLYREREEAVAAWRRIQGAGAGAGAETRTTTP